MDDIRANFLCGVGLENVDVVDLETAKQFFELCKRIEGATLIQIDHNGETLAECYNLRGVWQ